MLVSWTTILGQPLAKLPWKPPQTVFFNGEALMEDSFEVFWRNALLGNSLGVFPCMLSWQSLGKVHWKLSVGKLSWVNILNSLLGNLFKVTLVKNSLGEPATRTTIANCVTKIKRPPETNNYWYLTCGAEFPGCEMAWQTSRERTQDRHETLSRSRGRAGWYVRLERSINAYSVD